MIPGHRAPILAAVCLALSLAACASSPPPDAAAPASTAEPEGAQGAHEDYATFDILCTPPSEVKIDGKPIGKSPISKYKVPPGPHDVTCMDPVAGPSTMSFKLEPGQGQNVTMGRTPEQIDASHAADNPQPGKKK